MIREKQIDATDRAKLNRLKSKKYRDAYLEAQVHTWISYQFRALRKSMGLTQKEMAKKIGKPQSVVSRLENEEYGKVSVQTLLDVAHAVDVALLVQFVSYPDFLARMRDKSVDGMVPETVSHSIKRMDREFAAEATLQMLNRNPATGSSGIGSSLGSQGIFAKIAASQRSNFNRIESPLRHGLKQVQQKKEHTLQ